MGDQCGKINDHFGMKLMDECLGKRPVFLTQTGDGYLAYQQTYHSGIPCFEIFWHQQFGGRLQFGAPGFSSSAATFNIKSDVFKKFSDV